MIFERKKGVRFSVTSKLFLNENIYMSNSRINSYIDAKGYMGPVNCGSISLNKRLSIIKGFSESVERRAIAFGAKSVRTDPEYTYAYDILNEEITTIPKDVTKYSTTPPYIDTTGSAAHINPSYSLFKAVTESIEKNAVFLLWYGRLGKRIESTIKSQYKNFIEKQGYKITFILIDYFFPLKVVVTIAYSEKVDLKYKFGIGSSLDIMHAIEKSLSEACLVGSYYEFKLFNLKYGIQDREIEGLEWNEDKRVLEYLEDLSKLPYSSYDHEKFDDDDSPSYNLLKEILPKWVKEFFIVVLPQYINKNLIVIKTYSEQLYNHIPQKSFLDLNKEINKQTINLSQEVLNTIPDCPIL
jgi:hypothetical protein